MKTWNHFALFFTFAVVSVPVSAQTGQSSASAGLTENEAVLSSPRYREVHPESLGISVSFAEIEAKADRLQRQMAKLMANRAFAASPRAREEFPQLQRPPISAEKAQAKARQIEKQLARMMENAAWVSSPRAREDYPELLRAPTSLGASTAKTTRPPLQDISVK
jgi:hypothetical protein